VDHDNSSAGGNGPEEWRCCTNHVRGEKAGKVRGAATPGWMYKMEFGGNLEKTVLINLNTMRWC